MSRRIGIAAAIWGASLLLSRVIGIVREAVIGRVLGGDAEADVYWTAFVLPDFLNYLLAGGALSIVFIPMFAAYLQQDDEAAGWRSFSAIANVVLGVLVLATVGLWFAVPYIVPLYAPGFDADQTALLIRLTRIMLPAQIFHILGGLLSAVLQAKDKHGIPAFANLGYTGAIIVFGIALGPTLGAEGFAWGVLVGAVLGPFGLPLIGCLREGMKWRLLPELRHPDLKRWLLLSLPVMIAFSVIVVDDWLLKRFGSTLESGVISRLQYAKVLMKVPMGVFGLATGAAAYPTIARLVAEQKPIAAYDTLVRACRMMLVLAFVAQAAFTVAGADAATVIWGTDKFTLEELDQIGLYCGLFCLALGAWSASPLIARGFYAQEKTWIPSLLGSVVIAAFYPLYAVLAREMGGAGLALASTCAITAYIVVLSTVLRRSMAGPESPNIFGAVARMLPAVALGIAAGKGLDHVLSLPPLLQGALCGGVAALLTLGLARLFGVPEVAQVVELVVGKVRRKLSRA